jgi:hypothetical protein
MFWNCGVRDPLFVGHAPTQSTLKNKQLHSRETIYSDVTFRENEANEGRFTIPVNRRIKEQQRQREFLYVLLRQSKWDNTDAGEGSSYFQTPDTEQQCRLKSVGYIDDFNARVIRKKSVRLLWNGEASAKLMTDSC